MQITSIIIFWKDAMSKKSRVLSILMLTLFTILLVGCNGASTNDSVETNPNLDPPSSNNNSVMYTVSFDTNGANDLSPLTVEDGKTINLPTPIKEGYIFLGWFTGGSTNDGQFTSTSTVQSNITLYARWEPTLETLKSNALIEVQEFYDLSGFQGEMLEIAQENLTSSIGLINQASTISSLDYALRSAKAKYEIILVFMPYNEKCDEIDAKYVEYISRRESTIRSYEIYIDLDYPNTIIKNDHPNYRNYSLTQVTSLRGTAYNSYQACSNNFSCIQTAQLSTRQTIYFEWDKLFNQMTRIKNYQSEISQAIIDWDAEIAAEEAIYNAQVSQIKTKYGIN